MRTRDLERIIKRCWSKDTSRNPEEWNAHNPSRGQCVVTSLVVQDYLGGEILRAVAQRPDLALMNHYCNLVNNKTVDFTKQQFPKGTVIFPGSCTTVSTRDCRRIPIRKYFLSRKTIKNQYELLKERMEYYLNQKD
ncbi:hypothetical protein JW756_01055 [Candidatus Woesearchaeota archaeon]|nr:hypothetical protein [Candidatus Woesearchaeota archaeon]